MWKFGSLQRVRVACVEIWLLAVSEMLCNVISMGLNSPSSCFTVTIRISLTSILKSLLRGPQLVTYKKKFMGERKR